MRKTANLVDKGCQIYANKKARSTQFSACRHRRVKISKEAFKTLFLCQSSISRHQFSCTSNAFKCVPLLSNIFPTEQLWSSCWLQAFCRLRSVGQDHSISHQHIPLSCCIGDLAPGKGSSRFQSALAQLVMQRLRWAQLLPAGHSIVCGGGSALSLVTSQLKIMPGLLQGAVLCCCVLTTSCSSQWSHAFKHRHLIFCKLFLFQRLQAWMHGNAAMVARSPGRLTPGLREDKLDFALLK